ncbi:MAG: ABC transporter substrate-binding protein [Dehalococcoidia bacterium]
MITLRYSSVGQLNKRPDTSLISPPAKRGWSPIMRHAILLSVLMLVFLLLIACGNENGTKPPLTQSPEEATPAKDVVITIGNLSDLTGPAANAMEYINNALNDVVEYYNEENLIPGMRLKVETYDSQWDTSKIIPGYLWLRNRGADVIWTPVVPAAATLKPTADKDKCPIFAASVTRDILIPGGYVFSLGTIPQYDAYTLLQWIAENDWDYETNGPARIGGAAWADGYNNAVFNAMKDYADAHPEQFDFVEGYLTDFTFEWGAQIQGLKDCDYVWPPVPMHKFIQDYQAAGYNAKFIGSDPHAAFLGMIDTGKLWEEIGGMLFIRGSRWWTEEGKIIDLTRELLFENHPGEAEDIIRSGVGYLSVSAVYQLCDIIGNAAEEVGPANVDSQAIYEAAVSYSEVIDGVERYTFNETKRCSTNYYVIYEVDAEKRNLFRADPEWLSLITEP